MAPDSARAQEFRATASADGARVFFQTNERLVGADTDGLTDVYERSAGATKLVSAPGVGASGSAADSSLARISADGARVFFETTENLVAADTDGLTDIYERSAGATTLVSAPGAGASGEPANSGTAGISTDGSTVFFVTFENLVAADTDGTRDVYERSDSTTTLVSAPGAGASGLAEQASFVGSSSDGTTVFFETDENLVAADTDGLEDVYERSAGATTLVSAPGLGASGPPADAFSIAFHRRVVSSDGSKVFFRTAENLVAGDTDGFMDIYERSAGATTLVSAPGAGASGPPAGAHFDSASADGTKVFFETTENLVASDTDGGSDIYERSGGITTLVSAPGEGASGLSSSIVFHSGVSTDGTKVFFKTTDRLVGADTDGLFDVYERSGGMTTLVSAPGEGASGPGDDVPPAARTAFSDDGTRFFFETSENLVGADTDGLADVYERFGGTTTLVSAPGEGASGPPAHAGLEGSSADGSKVLFLSAENLVAADQDGLADVYERSGGVTSLVTMEAGPPTGIPPVASITSGPSGTTNDTTPTFGFSANEPGSSFECSLDSAPFGPCSGPGGTHTPEVDLAEGSHTFDVRAIDPAGNVGSPASRRFAIDTTPTAGGGAPPPTVTASAPDNDFTWNELRRRALSLTVPGPGRVEVRDAAPLLQGEAAQRRKRRLKPSTATASAAGTVVVKLNLTMAARMSLRERGRVGVKAAVTFIPTGGVPRTEIEKLKLKR